MEGLDASQQSGDLRVVKHSDDLRTTTERLSSEEDKESVPSRPPRLVSQSSEPEEEKKSASKTIGQLRTKAGLARPPQKLQPMQQRLPFRGVTKDRGEEASLSDCDEWPRPRQKAKTR